MYEPFALSVKDFFSENTKWTKNEMTSWRQHAEIINEDQLQYHFSQHSQLPVPHVQQPTTVEFHLDHCWMPFCDKISL